MKRNDAAYTKPDTGRVQHLSRRAASLLPLALAVSCASQAPPGPQASSILLAVDLADELRAGAILIDVRGATERRQDGEPQSRHHWLPFGADRWAGRPSDAEAREFVRAVHATIGPPGGRVILLCSVGVRSAAAMRPLAAAGYAVDSVMDGWLGNDMGPGFRAEGG